MVAVEKAVLNGAQLADALAKSGSGVRTLAPVRECLLEVHKKYNRIATANEVLAALEGAGDPASPYGKFREVTAAALDKARQLAETGKWLAPEHREEKPIEQLLLEGASVPAAPKAESKVEAAPGDRAEVTQLPATKLAPVQSTKKTPAAAE